MPFQITMSIAREVASVTRLGIEVGLEKSFVGTNLCLLEINSIIELRH